MVITLFTMGRGGAYGPRRDEMLHNSKLARAFVTFVTFVFSTLIWFRTFLEKVVAFPVLVANGCCFVGPRYLETKTKNDERYVKLNFVLYACNLAKNGRF